VTKIHLKIAEAGLLQVGRPSRWQTSHVTTLSNYTTEHRTNIIQKGSKQNVKSSFSHIIIIIIITLFAQRKQHNRNSELDSRAGQHGSKNKSYTDSCP